MSLIDDLIERLPESLREMVRAHIKAVLMMEFEESQQWLMQVLSSGWNNAYQALNDKLSPAERIVEQERLNQMIADYNKENKCRADMWREFFLALITLGMQKLEGEIIGS